MTTSTTTTQPESAGLAWPSLIWIGILHVGALLAFVPAFFTWQAVLLFVILHWVTGGLGITLTYHRLLTHRSFEVRPKWLEYVMTAVGCSASEGGAIGWVADHRAHHAHSDEHNDVHSPNRGFAWAHMLWWMTPDVTTVHSDEYYRKWAPDLMKDPVHRLMDKYFILFPIAGAIALFAIGGMPYSGLGLLRPVGSGPPCDLVGELGHARLGLPVARDPRHLDEPLVGGHRHLRRRLAQQPPRLSDLGPTRAALVGVRHATWITIKLMSYGRDGPQHQAAQADPRRPDRQPEASAAEGQEGPKAIRPLDDEPELVGNPA